MTVHMGCIADDITGGTDLALALSKSGLKVAQIFDLKSQEIPDVDAIVISLKIRTTPKDIAVSKALTAYDWLKARGAKQIYFKYCSTFDSTREGNIGPIAEAINARIGAKSVPFVPSFPENGRTVRQGNLYVNGQLLSESPMKDHPLTPMTESNLCVHLTSQLAECQTGLIPLTTIEQGSKAVSNHMQDISQLGQSFLIMDCMDATHLDTIAKACKSLSFVTGGSAFAGALATHFNVANPTLRTQIQFPHRNGPIAIFSGSCSAASQNQVKRASDKFPVIPLTMKTPSKDVLSKAIKRLDDGIVFVSSTAPPEAITLNHNTHGLEVGERIEQKFADIAKGLYQVGVRTFIVGGGETSGAVAKALDLQCLEVGPEIAPGVPWMTDHTDSGINIAFKSGNFGGPDFFSEAVNSLQLRQNGS